MDIVCHSGRECSTRKTLHIEGLLLWAPLGDKVVRAREATRAVRWTEFSNHRQVHSPLTSPGGSKREPYDSLNGARRHLKRVIGDDFLNLLRLSTLFHFVQVLRLSMLVEVLLVVSVFLVVLGFRLFTS